MRPYRGFADMIRRRRKDLGLTLAEVATEMGLSIPYISELERGVKQPPPDDGVDRLARVLKLDVDLLRREAALSRRTVEIDLEGVGLAQRELALLLARRFSQGLSAQEAEAIIGQLRTLEEEARNDD